VSLCAEHTAPLVLMQQGRLAQAVLPSKYNGLVSPCVEQTDLLVLMQQLTQAVMLSS
jgi:hypothetical protein